MRVEIVLDLDDGGHRASNLAKEFEADCAGKFRQSMQDETRRGDEAVAAFFLDAGQA
jgi:hypothetical protein